LHLTRILLSKISLPVLSEHEFVHAHRGILFIEEEYLSRRIKDVDLFIQFGLPKDYKTCFANTGCLTNHGTVLFVLSDIDWCLFSKDQIDIASRIKRLSSSPSPSPISAGPFAFPPSLFSPTHSSNHNSSTHLRHAQQTICHLARNTILPATREECYESLKSFYADKPATIIKPLKEELREFRKVVLGLDV
jgi:hypothetical protein